MVKIRGGAGARPISRRTAMLRALAVALLSSGCATDYSRRMLSGYVTMGQTGMGEMGQMKMPVPANSIPMVGGQGKHDVITMGGMFAVLKVRDRVKSYD